VLKEFECLEEEANIWKLTGPLMVRQDKEEAKSNVEKRLEFIRTELSKVEDNTKNKETEFETKRQELVKLQSQMNPNQTVGTSP
jgi:prefoldin beta subunit